MRKALDYILGKWPDLNTKIIELYHKEADFRILCEDYMASAQGIEESRQNAMREKEVESEFSDVHLELENEISRLLKDK